MGHYLGQVGVSEACEAVREALFCVGFEWVGKTESGCTV